MDGLDGPASWRGTLSHEEWLLARDDFEKRELTLYALCDKHRVTPEAVLARAAGGRWAVKDRPESIDRKILIFRMLGLLERQIAQLGNSMGSNGDKEAALLGNLAKTLEKLIELDGRQGGEAAPGNKDMAELRQRLGERIAQLKRG